MERDDRDELFDTDPIKQLKIENEILKLKIQAEHGAVFMHHQEVAPEIEADFLKHIQAFEEAWKDVKMIKVYDIVGRPAFSSEEDLDDKSLEEALLLLHELLNSHHIQLDIIGEYEPRVIYRFITEELFEQETDDLQLEGMTRHFVYEEFHPNHVTDIENDAGNFLEHWLECKVEPCGWMLEDEMQMQNGEKITRGEMIDRISLFFECFSCFKNDRYTITQVGFNWDEKINTGTGHAQGVIKYDAEMENGELVHYEGPFRLEMKNNFGFWGIVGLMLPGLKT